MEKDISAQNLVKAVGFRLGKVMSLISRCDCLITNDSGPMHIASALGVPVVVQDTGFGRTIPTGRGLLGFTTLEEAAAALREVDGDYERHARAAGEIAREFFDSARVLTRLLERIPSP